MPQGLLPQPGQMVLVRNRHGLVRDVREGGSPTAGGILHLVEVEYLDDRTDRTADTVIWEREVGATVVSSAGLPELDRGQPDPPARYQAFLDAIRWSAVSQVVDPKDSAADQPFLLSPWYGAVQVEDYQLYPVLKALSMPRISLLLADDVGLGKTVEAGLILAELIARRRARRVLIICPASLQIQWEEEMRSKFNLDFIRLDRAGVEKLQREMGMDANPWASTPRIITSMDYLRQPDVLNQFLTATRAMYREGSPLLPWDLLIVDEAHNFMPGHVGSESHRTRTLREVAAHFEHRLFLTATPHNGFTASFTGLLELLDPVRFQRKAALSRADHQQVRTVMVRRLKREINARSSRPRFPRRHVRQVQVTLHPLEQALFQALRRYRDQALEAVGGSPGSNERRMVRFLFSLLTKRLLSSTYAFARTWWAHVAGYDLAEADLATAQAAAERAEAAVEDDTERAVREQDAARHGAAWLRQKRAILAPYLDRVSSALSTLGWTREAVEAPLGSATPLVPDGRWDALVGWLREYLYDGDRLRADERLILFTEYRDTQEYLLWRLQRELGLADPLVLPLYGGATLELRDAVKAQFNDSTSPLRILVATDAASEGLNLQHSCRYVLHQEIPWNPMRLEQRNGRVDRHGQEREVTVFHFTSDSDADLQFLDYVVQKVNTVREDLGSVGQVLDTAIQGYFSGESITRAVLDEKLALAQTSSEEAGDLEARDAGEEPHLQRQLDHLKVRERELGLSPAALARLLTEAVTLAGGEVRPVPGEDQGPEGPTVLQLTSIPRGWQRIVESSLVVPGGRPGGPLPKLAFDPGYFEERRDGRIFFRPRPDAVLIRLGHPLMRKAVGTLRPALWQPGSVRRWTVVAAGRDLPEEAVLVVWVLVSATNRLREAIHEELIPLVYVPVNGRLRPLDPRLSAFALGQAVAPLPPDELAFWQEHLQEYWVEYRRALRTELARRKDEEQARLNRWLAQWAKAEARREEKAFAARFKELEESRDHKELERAQKAYIAALRKAQQMTLSEEENAANLAALWEAEQRLQAANFALQLSHIETLRARLERDRDRILKQVIPQRFTLEHLEVYPVAVELRVRSRGVEGVRR